MLQLQRRKSIASNGDGGSFNRQNHCFASHRCSRYRLTLDIRSRWHVVTFSMHFPIAGKHGGLLRSSTRTGEHPFHTLYNHPHPSYALLPPKGALRNAYTVCSALASCCIRLTTAVSELKHVIVYAVNAFYGPLANGHAAQPASVTLPRRPNLPSPGMPSSTAVNAYSYSQYPPQTQVPMQQPQQNLRIYLPQRSQAHLPPPSQSQPQQTSHSLPALSTTTRKSPPAPLLSERSTPAVKGPSYSAQVHNQPSKANSTGYYPPTSAPAPAARTYHAARPPDFQPRSGPAAPVPISPPHNRLAFQQTAPLPTWSMPQLNGEAQTTQETARFVGYLGGFADLTSFTTTHCQRGTPTFTVTHRKCHAWDGGYHPSVRRRQGARHWIVA